MNRLTNQPTETIQFPKTFAITPHPSHRRRKNCIGWAAFGLITFLAGHLLLSTFIQPAEAIYYVGEESSFWDVLRDLSRILFQICFIVYFSVKWYFDAPLFLAQLRRRSKTWLVGCICITTLFLLSCLMSPAHAAFYSAAEAFFTSSFPQAGVAIPLIFNALRGIFLIYVAIALIAVMNAFRQGEEWLTVAKSPAAVIVVVALGDVLSTIIIA